MAFPFDPARLAVGAAVRRAATQQSGAFTCAIHGPLNAAHGRKCPQCGPPWIRHVHWDPKAVPLTEPMQHAPVLDSPPRTAPDPAQLAIALAALNEFDRLAHARALGCGVGWSTPVRPEDYPGSWVCLTCNAPATDRCHDKRHALAGCPSSHASASVGPVPESHRPLGRQRDALGRYTCEAREAVPPDERMAGEPLRAAFRAFWFHLPRGSRKPFARHVRVPFNTLHRYGKGRIDLPAACQRRISKALNLIARDGLELVELCPGTPPRRSWAAGRPSHTWTRREPRRRAPEASQS